MTPKLDFGKIINIAKTLFVWLIRPFITLLILKESKCLRCGFAKEIGEYGILVLKDISLFGNGRWFALSWICLVRKGWSLIKGIRFCEKVMPLSVILCETVLALKLISLCYPPLFSFGTKEYPQKLVFFTWDTW